MGENQLDAFAAKFLKTLHFTKGARFAAHRRLLRKHQWSLLSISMLSTYVIGASLIPIFVKPLPVSAPGILAAITTVASIFIIVLSHVESGQGYFTRAEKMLRCAQKISELYYELDQRRMTFTQTEELLTILEPNTAGSLTTIQRITTRLTFYITQATSRQLTFQRKSGPCSDVYCSADTTLLSITRIFVS